MAETFTVDRAAPSKLGTAWERQLWASYVKGDSAGSRVWRPMDTACETMTLRAKAEGRLRDQAFQLTGACWAGGLPGGGGLESLVGNSSYQHNGARWSLDCRTLW